MNKNHIIKAFKVSEQTWDKFNKASKEIGIKNSELSRLLFNRALTEMLTLAQDNGWNNIQITLKELN